MSHVENDYWIVDDVEMHLMHKIVAHGKEYHVCVGGAEMNNKGIWEIRMIVSQHNPSQILVGMMGSRSEARELLWEQRNKMYFGRFQ